MHCSNLELVAAAGATAFIANVSLVRPAFMDENSIGYSQSVAQNGCCENHMGLFLIGEKRCFITLAFLDGIPKVSAWI